MAINNSQIPLLCKRLLAIVLIIIVQTGGARRAAARPITASEARKAVSGWLAREPRPLNAKLGGRIAAVETHLDARGAALYYVVSLAPAGFAIVAGDDLAEPVVAFADDGRFDASARNPLGAMVGRDLPARVGQARIREKAALAKGAALAPGPEEARARSKWALLWREADRNGEDKAYSIPDVRVGPLLQSAWSQDTDASGAACYNYYTPPYAAGTAENYPCGCVATMMAQVMRFFRYPVVGVGTAAFKIIVDGENQSRRLRGGNGSGGAYDWNAMPPAPGSAATAAQRRAIGALTHDAGVAVEMEYTSDGSGADMALTATRMISVFRFGSVEYGYAESGTFPPGSLGLMINPSLDAGCPVMLGISADGADGHAVVCDGYGYSAATLYHHVNPGWAGSDDAWYRLPNIDTYDVGFNILDEIVYNIFTSGSGEIVSGRVTDGGGKPLAGVTVKATRGTAQYTDQTYAKGIYALAKLPSGLQFTVAPQAAGWSFTARTVQTGTSREQPFAVGNRWGVDFSGTARSPARGWSAYH